MTKIISSRLNVDMLYYRLRGLLETMSDIAEADVIGELPTSEDVVTALELLMTRFAADYEIQQRMHSAIASDFITLSAENVQLQRQIQDQLKKVDLAIDLVDTLVGAPKDSIIIDDTLEHLIENSSATVTSEYRPDANTNVNIPTADDDFETRITAEKNSLRVGLKSALQYYIDKVGHKVIDDHRP